MNKIQDKVEKFRIPNPDIKGVARWESKDLLGDSHKALITWDEKNLRIEKFVSYNDCDHLNFSVSWKLSESGRLILKEKFGFAEEFASTLDIIKFIRRELEGGDAPIVENKNSKGLSL